MKPIYVETVIPEKPGPIKVGESVFYHSKYGHKVFGTVLKVNKVNMKIAVGRAVFSVFKNSVRRDKNCVDFISRLTD